MSEVLSEERFGVPGWAWFLAAIAGVCGAIGGGIYLLYQYFIAPGNVILDQYQAILKDIYKETKQFLDENANQAIYGLTTGQEAILAAKQGAADKLRPEVEKIIYERGMQLYNWVETVIIGIVLTLAVPYVADKLVGLVKKWRSEKPEASSEIQSNWGHEHMIFDIIANEYALAGKTPIASAFYNANIPEIYSTYTQPGLNADIITYNTLLTQLLPGTIEYLVAQQMLTYLTYEVSATTGIMAVLHVFWLPPLI